jgi:hypothetical protein
VVHTLCAAGVDRRSDAIERAEHGLIDADLGGGIIKQRVARAGKGRSGGYRMLIAYRFGSRAVFMYGIAKNERDNIDSKELATLREIGATWLEANAEQLELAITEGLDSVNSSMKVRDIKMEHAGK